MLHTAAPSQHQKKLPLKSEFSGSHKKLSNICNNISISSVDLVFIRHVIYYQNRQRWFRSSTPAVRGEGVPLLTESFGLQRQNLFMTFKLFRPSEHPPVRRGEMSKRIILGGIIGCKNRTSCCVLHIINRSGTNPVRGLLDREKIR